MGSNRFFCNKFKNLVKFFLFWFSPIMKTSTFLQFSTFLIQLTVSFLHEILSFSYVKQKS